MSLTPAVVPPGNSPRPEGSTFKRRKFVDKGATKPRGPLDFSALEGAIEDDNAVIESLRRDVNTFQQFEIENSQEYLATLRKTYDRLKAITQQKEQEHLSVASELDEVNRLLSEQKGVTDSEESSKQEHCKQLEFELRELQKKLGDTAVQRDIFNHMLARLVNESIELDREGEQLEREIEKDGIELQICTRAFQQAKQELKNEDTRFQALHNKVTQRREDQSNRTKEMEKVVKDRTLLLERQEERQRLRTEMFEKSAREAGYHEEEKLKKMQVVRKVYSSMLEKKMNEDEDDLENLEETFQHIKIVTGLSDVDEIVHKFLTRSEKAHQLERDADDVRQRIEGLKKQNEAQRQILEAMKAESQNTAGNRKAIFEMEKSVQDLQDLRNQCDEAKTRAYRSSVALEELKTAVARFRSKVEGKQFSTPKNDQLPDFLKELDIRLGAKMRSVAEMLNQEDGFSGSKSASESAEASFAKVQSDRLMQILYQKMMQSVPDSGDRNLRVQVRPNLDDLNRRHRRMLLDDYYQDFVEADGVVEEDEEDHIDSKERDFRDVVIDRQTVKKISGLVSQRDNPKTARRRKGNRKPSSS